MGLYCYRLAITQQSHNTGIREYGNPSLLLRQPAVVEQTLAEMIVGPSALGRSSVTICRRIFDSAKSCVVGATVRAGH